VRDVMSSDASCVSQSDTLLTAAKKVVWSGLGAVPVKDSTGALAGIMSEADLLRQVSRETDLAATAVGDLVLEAHCVNPDDTVEQARQLLASRRLPILPVVDDGHVAGVVTWFDISAHRRLVAALGPHTEDLIAEISPSDAMYMASRGAYVTAGVSALECVKRSMEAAGKPAIGRLLDLPCGHGRVMRVMKAAFPEAHLTACDLDRNAVDFCARVFGADPVYSSLDPSDVHFDQDYDLIWCGSLFTHLDASRWVGFLDLFARSLSKDGLLLFTTHGLHPPRSLRGMGVNEQGVSEMLEAYRESGFAYTRADFKLDERYGLSMSSPEWVLGRIKEQGDLTVISQSEKGWEPPAPSQDVFACIRMS
jgi:hypothetical protein